MTEHDEYLLRVASYLRRVEFGYDYPILEATDSAEWLEKARGILYPPPPPAPPKTRLQVARELCAAEDESEGRKTMFVAGHWDETTAMRAVLAALALPATED